MTELDQRGAVHGVFWTAIQSIGVRLFSLLVFIVLARLLSPSDFGLLAMAGVFVALGDALVAQGFGTAITQREELEPEHESTAFWTNMLAGVGLGGLLYAAAPVDRPALRSAGANVRHSMVEPSASASRRCRGTGRGFSSAGSSFARLRFARSWRRSSAGWLACLPRFGVGACTRWSSSSSSAPASTSSSSGMRLHGGLALPSRCVT